MLSERYHHGLKDWAEGRGVRLPRVPEDRESAYHLFYLIMPDVASREGLIQWLKEQGIMAVFHYLPLHISEYGRRFGGVAGDCPVTEWVSDRLIRLPLFHGLEEAEQERVIEGVLRFGS